MESKSGPTLTDRTAPLVFAGKSVELGALHRQLSVVMNPNVRHRTGGLVLVDGVRGVVKTQLLGEFFNR